MAHTYTLMHVEKYAANKKDQIKIMHEQDAL